MDSRTKPRAGLFDLQVGTREGGCGAADTGTATQFRVIDHGMSELGAELAAADDEEVPHLVRDAFLESETRERIIDLLASWEPVPLAEFQQAVVQVVYPLFVDDSPSVHERSPCDVPVMDGKRLVSALVRACEPSPDDLHSAVCSLVRNNCLAMAQHLVAEHGADLRLRPEFDEPPLFNAVRNCAYRSIDWLVNEMGQDVCEVANGGDDTVLSYAHSCASGSDVWLLQHHPTCAEVVDAPSAHVEAVAALTARAS
jgi:hypothetical protein